MAAHFFKMIFFIFLSLFTLNECFELDIFISTNFSTFADCSEEVKKFEIPCLEMVKDRWQISEEINSTDLTNKQFCCSTWDYMLCIIKYARDVCSQEDLNLIIEDSIEVEKGLEEDKCYHYSRDDIFACHFYWYYYMIVIIGIICLFVVILMITVNICRQQKKYPKKIEIIKVKV
jgi:hypothetical protein